MELAATMKLDRFNEVPNKPAPPNGGAGYCLPAAVTGSQAYRDLPQGHRATLTAVAAACRDGSATGGSDLQRAAGCSRRTWWRHVERLVAVGLIVRQSTGGRFGGRKVANVYTLSQPDSVPSTCHSDTSATLTLVSKWHSHVPKKKTCKDHGVPAKRHQIKTPDLEDDGKLLDLLERWVALGWVDPGEHSRLRFVAAAEHALRIGSNPPALFVHLVKGKRWLYISDADEDRAQERIKRHLYADQL